MASKGGEDQKNEEKKDESNIEPGEEVEDLGKLLDSCLNDFGKSVPPAASGSDGTGFPPGSVFPNQEAAQQAAKEFENLIKQLVEVQKGVALQQPAQGAPAPGSLVGAAAEAGPFPGAIGDGNLPFPLPFPVAEEGMDEAKFAEAMMQSLSSLANKAQKVAQAKDEQEFNSAMEDMNQEESYENEFLPFMQGLMGSLMSKDMMYPSLKEMSEKYPMWLEEHKGSLSPEDVERYEKQMGLMSEACREYEAEKEDDSDDVVAARFEKLIQIMQQMQMCGSPPEELVGSMPPGWSMDPSSGMPQVVDSSQAAESCSIM